MPDTARIRVVDSHTGGEPTRIIVAGGPDLGSGSMAERLHVFRERFDYVRSAVVNEPRGSDVMVGALLCASVDPGCAAGVIFFNNVGYLGMCGHGAIGLGVTLRHLGRIGPGTHRVETPAGEVTLELAQDAVAPGQPNRAATARERSAPEVSAGAVSVANVPSYRTQTNILAGGVRGDVAWGGNWFFLVHEHGQELTLDRVEQLTDFTWRIREDLRARGITGDLGAEIDHIELFGPSQVADSRNFVLCPGKAFDRSPCGTGTSAKLACLAADGKLAEGAVYRQESIVGSVFAGTYRRAGDRILPTITGRAWVCAEADLILDPSDPFRWGIRP